MCDPEEDRSTSSHTLSEVTLVILVTIQFCTLHVFPGPLIFLRHSGPCRDVVFFFTPRVFPALYILDWITAGIFHFLKLILYLFI